VFPHISVLGDNYSCANRVPPHRRRSMGGGAPLVLKAAAVQPPCSEAYGNCFSTRCCSTHGFVCARLYSGDGAYAFPAVAQCHPASVCAESNVRGNAGWNCSWSLALQLAAPTAQCSYNYRATHVRAASTRAASAHHSETVQRHKQAYATLVYGSKGAFCGAAVLGMMLRRLDPTRPRVALVAGPPNNAALLTDGALWSTVAVSYVEARSQARKNSLWRLPYERVLYIDVDMWPALTLEEDASQWSELRAKLERAWQAPLLTRESWKKVAHIAGHVAGHVAGVANYRFQNNGSRETRVGFERAATSAAAPVLLCSQPRRARPRVGPCLCQGASTGGSCCCSRRQMHTHIWRLPICTRRNGEQLRSPRTLHCRSASSAARLAMTSRSSTVRSVISPRSR
jgi:hypothetical protein